MTTFINALRAIINANKPLLATLVFYLLSVAGAAVGGYNMGKVEVSDEVDLSYSVEQFSKHMDEAYLLLNSTLKAIVEAQEKGSRYNQGALKEDLKKIDDLVQSASGKIKEMRDENMSMGNRKTEDDDSISKATPTLQLKTIALFDSVNSKLESPLLDSFGVNAYSLLDMAEKIRELDNSSIEKKLGEVKNAVETLESTNEELTGQIRRLLPPK